MVVLADGQRAVSRRGLRSFLRLRSDEDRICDRPVCHGIDRHSRCATPGPRQPRLSPPQHQTKRQLDVLDKRLADNEYLGGGKYTIADIAVFPWYGGLVKGWSYDAAEFLQVQDYKHVQRWADTILERPAVQRGRMVNRVRGELSSQLHERHEASDFETKTQDKLTTVK